MGVKFILFSLMEENKMGIFAEENIWNSYAWLNMGTKTDYRVRNIIKWTPYEIQHALQKSEMEYKHVDRIFWKKENTRET
jgi:hypothetical protein